MTKIDSLKLHFILAKNSVDLFIAIGVNIYLKKNAYSLGINLKYE